MNNFPMTLLIHALKTIYSWHLKISKYINSFPKLLFYHFLYYNVYKIVLCFHCYSLMSHIDAKSCLRSIVQLLQKKKKAKAITHHSKHMNHNSEKLHFKDHNWTSTMFCVKEPHEELSLLFVCIRSCSMFSIEHQCW